MRLGAALAVAASSIGPIQAAVPSRPLTLNGAWVMNYDEDSCQLSANFGPPENRVGIRFTRYRPGDDFELLLSGEHLPGTGAIASADLLFGPAGAAWKGNATMADIGKVRIAIISSTSLRESPFDGRGRLTTVVQSRKSPPITIDAVSLSPVAPAREAAVSDLTVSLGRSQSFRLALGSMGQPMAAMRTCTDDLLRHWGFNPELGGKLRNGPVPIGNPASWATTSDYPQSALRAGASGNVRFRVDVAEDGKIVGCRILFRTRPDEFADLTCRLISRRARFNPALDAEGKPVKWFYINQVRWVN